MKSLKREKNLLSDTRVPCLHRLSSGKKGESPTWGDRAPVRRRATRGGRTARCGNGARSSSSSGSNSKRDSSNGRRRRWYPLCTKTILRLRLWLICVQPERSWRRLERYSECPVGRRCSCCILITYQHSDMREVPASKVTTIPEEQRVGVFARVVNGVLLSAQYLREYPRKIDTDSLHPTVVRIKIQETDIRQLQNMLLVPQVLRQTQFELMQDPSNRQCA